MNQKVDWFFEKDTKWQAVYGQLRSIMLDCGLTEELKWGCPCYTVQSANVVLIHGFKEYCALLFHKGVLLADPENLLIQQTENVQSARQLRFTSLQEVIDLTATIKSYVFEALEVEKAGLEVKMKKTDEFEMPVELTDAFAKDADFETAFKALTPGRQRGYLLHFTQAKQANTRASRIENSKASIFEGKGRNDK